jgi:NTP pyrophosphatase (non-canonical NTP hydrolase)
MSEPDQSRNQGGVTLRALQRAIEAMYGAKDAARGDAATVLDLTEEFGELATALRSGTQDELALEMADVLAWLATLANIRGIDLEDAVSRKYGRGCPGCGRSPCACDPADKP